MKTLLLSICLIFVLAISGLCDCTVMIAGKKVASCTTANDEIKLNKLGTGTGDTYAWYCVKWVLASNITLTEYIVRQALASGTASMKVCMLPHNAGTDLPDGTTCITGTDVTLPYSAYTGGGNYDNQIFTLGTPLNVDAGTYWVCSNSGGGYRTARSASTGDRMCRTGSSGCDYAVANYKMETDVYGCSR